MTNLETRVQTIIGALIREVDPNIFSDAYHEHFSHSGQEKAKGIIEHLRKYPDFDLSRCAYLSIGGSEGSEIAAIMQETPIRYGILLEYDAAVIPIVHRRTETLQQQGKTLCLEIGDVMQRIRSCNGRLRNWRAQGLIDGVICSAQAVLHELPSRSPGFDLDHVLGMMFWDFSPCLFYSREPCRPEGWPDQVKLKLHGLSSESLAALAQQVAAYRRIPGSVRTAGPEFVTTTAVLATETLMKLFYLDSYAHEIEEQLTSVDPAKLTRKLEEHLGNGCVTTQTLASESFQRFYREFGVDARDTEGHSLAMPRPFVRIFAARWKAPAAIEPVSLSIPLYDPEPLMHEALFTTLLSSSETTKVDFKSAPYRLDNDELKSRFVKDIIALANTNPPDVPGYILIGVREHVADAHRECIGVTNHPDDNTLQQLVRSQVTPIPDFNYVAFTYQGKQFGVIRVLPSRELCQATSNFGVLREHVCYTRKGSRNSEVSAQDITELVRARIHTFAIPQLKAWIPETTPPIRTSPTRRFCETLDKGDRLKVRFDSQLNSKWKDPLAYVIGCVDEDGKLVEARWPLRWRQQQTVTIHTHYRALCIPGFEVEPEWREATYVQESPLWSSIKAHVVGRFIASRRDCHVNATVRAIGMKDRAFLYLHCVDYDHHLNAQWPYFRGLETALRRSELAYDTNLASLPTDEINRFVSDELLSSRQIYELVPDHYRAAFKTKEIEAEAVSIVLEGLIQETQRVELRENNA